MKKTLIFKRLFTQIWVKGLASTVVLSLSAASLTHAGEMSSVRIAPIPHTNDVLSYQRGEKSSAPAAILAPAEIVAVDLYDDASIDAINYAHDEITIDWGSNLSNNDSPHAEGRYGRLVDVEWQVSASGATAGSIVMSSGHGPIHKHALANSTWISLPSGTMPWFSDIQRAYYGETIAHMNASAAVDASGIFISADCHVPMLAADISIDAHIDEGLCANHHHANSVAMRSYCTGNDSSVSLNTQQIYEPSSPLEEKPSFREAKSDFAGPYHSYSAEHGDDETNENADYHAAHRYEKNKKLTQVKHPNAPVHHGADVVGIIHAQLTLHLEYRSNDIKFNRDDLSRVAITEESTMLYYDGTSSTLALSEADEKLAITLEFYVLLYGECADGLPYREDEDPFNRKPIYTKDNANQHGLHNPNATLPDNMAPEPSTVTLSLLGLTALCARRRRKP